jgi:hypothetical protein
MKRHRPQRKRKPITDDSISWKEKKKRKMGRRRCRSIVYGESRSAASQLTKSDVASTMSTPGAGPIVIVPVQSIEKTA